MRRILGAVLVCVVGSLLAVAEAPQVIRIPRVHRAPKLQDFIDGTPREAEVAVSEFVQFDPTDGAPASQPTTAYLSYDDKNLYVAWICKDDPAKIRARLAKRKDIGADDRVTINIDTFLDRKHAYWFDVNPYGVQYDGRTTDGQGDDDSWESLWYSEGRLTPDGYVILQAIPFRSLRFPAGTTQRWGFCLARFIQRNNEMAIYPAVTRKKLPRFVGQYADLEIPEDISPGRNLQFIPYGMFSGTRYLDPTKGFTSGREQRVGLDAKMVIKDALNLDVAINPDFSQVESDEPQVTVNQRYEVIYPERRPFFMENASLFKLPEQLFFSRRIVDPQFGTRLTGTLGKWNLGFLVADDRAPGHQLELDDPKYGTRALDEVVRVERQFGQQSHIGALITNTDFGSTYNRVADIDGRLAMHGGWVAHGQFAASTSRLDDGTHADGTDLQVGVSRNTTHSYIETGYLDRSPGLRADLGYLNRVNIRKISNYGEYRWRPKNSVITDFGPALSQYVTWQHDGGLIEWGVTPQFVVNLKRLSYMWVEHGESMETYEGVAFRKRFTEAGGQTELLKWLAFRADIEKGDAINYYPAPGLVPFLAKQVSASAGFTVRPKPQLRVDQSYMYTHLGTTQEWLAAYAPQSTPVLFNDHILRTKANYQFSRSLSLRAILDYHGMLPNPTLVADSDSVPLEKSKRVGADLLLTYLVHPGTALYVGYSDGYENLSWNPLMNPALQRRNFPGTSTGRQVFVKLSYLFRY